MSFKEWLENQDVYRVDPSRVSDFSQNLKTYHRSPDWSSSGTFEKESDVPADWQKETGLFAGQLKDVVPYAVPRDVRWIITYGNPKRPTVTFEEVDKPKIVGNQPYLSRFPASQFNQTPSGEFFSGNPNQLSKQEAIRKPLNFIRRWYEVRFVPNLEKLANQLRTQNVEFSSEGL